MTGRTYLFVLTGSLGDVVRGLPLVDAIKASDPAAQITWLIEDTWQKILSMHPRIDRMIVFERKRGWRGVVSLWRALRNERFDVVFDLQRNFKSGIFNRWARATTRVGFHPRDSKEGNWIFQTDYIPRRGDSISKTDHYLLFLDAVGIQQPETLTFGFEEIDSAALIGDLLDAAHCPIVMVLGSSWPSKDWLVSGYAQLIDLIRKRSSSSVILAGDPSQSPIANQLLAAVGNERIINLVSKTTLIQLVGVLHRAKVAVGPDSGPGHISAAVGTPYVTLFGPTNPVRVAPYRMQHLSLRVDLGCSPCYRRECPGLNKFCMRLISPEAVFEKIQTVLSSL